MFGFDWNKDKKKKDKKKKAKSYSASSFWYDDYDYDYIDYDYTDRSKTYTPAWIAAEKKSLDMYKLVSVRKAIANFVSIVTGKSIPVNYNSVGDSYTDGKTVTLASNVGDKFDVSVGLALHEGSHILLSDFRQLAIMAKVHEIITESVLRYHPLSNVAFKASYFSTAMGRIDNLIDNHNTQFAATRGEPFYGSEFTSAIERIVNPDTGLVRFITKTDADINEILETLRAFTNWIEDRRIDNFIYKSAPGYREYYKAMYNHYFEDKEMTKAIASDQFTQNNVESYMVRIVNILNEKTDINKLPGLRDCVKLLDLNNIGRLKSSNDSLNLAIELVDLIYSIIDKVKKTPSLKPPGKGAPKNGNEGEEDNQNQQGESSPSSQQGNKGPGQSNSNPSNSNDEDDNDSDPNGDAESAAQKMSPKLEKAIQKQKDFINGDIKKKKLSKTDVKKLNVIYESGSELKHVGEGYSPSWAGRTDTGVDCIVVKNCTEAVVKSEGWPYRYSKDCMEHEVRKGIQLGTALGGKLQIRSESRETIYNRQAKGKIDGRMIASLGYENENVFYTNEVDMYKKANLHISVDYSGSMHGRRLDNAITLTVAIAKACAMTRNIDVQVSIRSSTGMAHTGCSLPHIAMVYDSRKDSLKKLYTLLGGMTTANTTPEGLCFEAILNQLIPGDTNIDSYFLNMSDGEPAFSSKTISYGGEDAAEHTYKQVRKFKERGIHVMSYYISENSGDVSTLSSWKIFSKAYRADAKHINTNNLMQIAKTMNELFLKKNNDN